MQEQPHKARCEIRNDMNKALQSFVDGLPSASSCVVNRVKTGWWLKEFRETDLLKSALISENKRDKNYADIAKLMNMLTNNRMLRLKESTILC